MQVLVRKCLDVLLLLLVIMFDSSVVPIPFRMGHEKRDREFIIRYSRRI